MPQIPFNVSARAAMLIGRENIANSKGAMIELVKNCYDADSDFCIIYIDNELSTVKSVLTSEEKEKMLGDGIDGRYFKKIYTHNSGRYFLKEDARKLYLEAFKRRVKKLAIIYIIDVGDGMTERTIIDHWMTIGTDNKLNSYRTNSKRIKSGAKGIGRFALDKLGEECTMTTIPDARKLDDRDGDRVTGSVWQVKWRDFEGGGKKINQVSANLEELIATDLVASTYDIKSGFNLSEIWENIQKLENKLKLQLPEFDTFGGFTHGTVLKISKPNENWDSEHVRQVYEDLEMLIPPRDIENFRIFLLSSLQNGEYGEVLGPDCEDYDYKVVAKATKDKKVEITIHRDEFVFENIPKAFFERDGVKSYPLGFTNKEFKINTTLSDLLSGYNDSDNTLELIGPFEFSFYSLKRSTNSKDSKRFYYKDFPAVRRKEWLDQFAGIKIYRDNFRVRPYGEMKQAAFDWLGLGPRQSSSPAGVAKETNGYKVRPENIAGAIHISRLTNIEFADKSSREGLQETKAFRLFKNIIISIIDKFERDRSYIARELANFDKSQMWESTSIGGAVGEDKVREIIERENRKRKYSNVNNLKTHQYELSLLAHYIEEKNEENEKLLEEQKLLRGMASSGIVAASFGHDLSKTKDNLNTRFDELTRLFEKRVKRSDFDDVHKFDNPYNYINLLKKEDRNIAMWLGFSLGFTRKDKRKRKQIVLNDFFSNMKSNWLETLSDRGITMTIDCPLELNMRIFEIDFDSIFLNLLVNSIDAFRSSRPRTAASREVNVTCTSDGAFITIIYTDNGPGLPENIGSPEVIFEPMFTTRRDADGDEIGTGLGMWIVKTVSDEYQANARIVKNPNVSGFGIRFDFPIRYSKQRK